MSSLKEVAKHAGVSIATASYCINQTKSVSPATYAKVMKAVEELNYIPNAAAKNLKAESTSEIGVIFPNIDDYYYSELFKGIISVAESEYFSVNLGFSYNSPKMERQIIRQMISKNVSGLVILSCQEENSGFFQKNIISRNLPCVFLERLPANTEANFFAFNDYDTYYFLTSLLLETGYSKIILFTGNSTLFSEYNGMCGYVDAYEDQGASFSPSWIIETGMSKEEAFKQTMLHLVQAPPQAIISASESMTKGIVEAFHLCNIKIPENTCIISMGEETWNSTAYIPNVLYTFRAAYTLGRACVQTLIRNIKKPKDFQKEFHLYEDDILQTGIQLPPPPLPYYRNQPAQNRIRILATSLPTITSLRAVTTEFTLNHNIGVDFHLVDSKELVQAIVQDSLLEENAYDLYLFDVVWLPYLVNANALRDITEVISENPDFHKQFLDGYLEDCCYKEKYYGVPLSGGSHLLFYRKDLFEQPAIRRLYKEHHALPLRPPKTWKEFNAISKFFSQEFNTYSPTAYGTSMVGSSSEELAMEILIRLWSFGGDLYDKNHKLTLNTPENRKAFQNMLDTTAYIASTPGETSTSRALNDFCFGRTAMLISFSEYAANIRDGLHGDTIADIGYSIPPGYTPAKVGWHFGLSKRTKKEAEIAKYIDWIYKKSTSYYLTTLNGQSASKYPYQNHELLKNYPWLEMNHLGQEYARSRIYPYRSKTHLITPSSVENILSDAFRDMYYNHIPIEKALDRSQKRLEQLFYT